MFGRMCIKLQMQTQIGHKQIQIGICSDKNRILADPYGYTFRYGLRYICPDLDCDTFRYKWDTCTYGYTFR